MKINDVTVGKTILNFYFKLNCIINIVKSYHNTKNDVYPHT